MRNRFASLTSRLVLTAVALVVVISVLIATVATVAIRSSLIDRLDDAVRSSVDRASDFGRGGPEGGVLGGGAGPVFGPEVNPGNQGPGTLIAFLDASPEGFVLTEARDGRQPISSAVLDELAGVAVDDAVHGVDLPGFGTYRVTATRVADGVVIVSGLPTTDVDHTVSSLIGYEAALILLGALLAGAAGVFVVRRQLRPLREVADTAHAVSELPLDAGDVDLSARVGAHLTDERTEVGQVGAALNTLLDHVETSLEARQRSEQQVRQFVADASHELRTPLATIAGYTQLARRRPDDAAMASMALDKVEEESGRMTSLVEDLLLLARLDAGRPLDVRPVDLTRLLLEAVSDARVLGPGHHWRLDLPEESVEVPGDEQRLHQVVTNLLANARRHTPAGTTVTVTATARGFCVHDDGPGFSGELVEVAFERFARGDAARHREGGAGLGLALVDAIVSAHHGRVSLTSEPGSTTIRVHLLTGGAR